MTKATLLILLLLFTTSVPASDKPNIILVFIDDMGWSDFSCFGNKDTTTTNIDSLASEGICFEQFYVNSPICSPSRVAISTGQYPQRWDVTSYLANRASNEKRGIANWLDPKAPMLARTLKENGYITGHFGKWHMGGQRNVGDAPLITGYGFDESLTNFEGLGPRLLPLVRTPMKPEFKKIWQDSAKLGRGEVTWTDRSKITGGFVDAAVKFIDKAKEAEKPFYINLWPDDVHSPFFPSLEGWRNGKDKRNLYLSVLKEMDTQFGTLFNKIKSDEKLKNNTLILICSDNGHEPGAGQSGPLRGMKTNLFEGGIRSSLVVWGPGFIPEGKQGSRNKTSLFSAVDLVPSILKLAGIESKADYVGEVLTETIIGKSEKSRQKAILYRRPPDRKYFYGSTNPDLAIRKGPWKLYVDFNGANIQLYNIPKDHGEKNDLSDEKPELVGKLTKELFAWHNLMPKDNDEAHVIKQMKKLKK